MAIVKSKKLRNLIITSAAVAILAFILHKPLPKNFTQRNKMHFLEPLMRLTYYYPVKILGYFGFYDGQIAYSRKTLSFYSFLVNQASKWLFDGIKSAVDDTFDGIPVRIYTPEALRHNGAIVFMHGGGFVLYDVESADSVVRQIARWSGMVTVSVDYRLAPEHLFPTAVDDSERALISFMNVHYKKYGVDNSKIVLMGDSAGGNLAAVLSQRMNNNPKIPYPIKLQVLIYPFIQLVDLLTPSYQYARRVTDGTSFLDPESIARWMLLYLGIDLSYIPKLLKNAHTSPGIRQKHAQVLRHLNHAQLPQNFANFSFYSSNSVVEDDENDSENSANDVLFSEKLEKFIFNPDFSPIMTEKSLKGLAPALIFTCEFDPLRDEGFWYYNRLKNEGVETKWIHYDQGFHGMINFHTELKLAQTLFKDIAKFLDDHFVGEQVKAKKMINRSGSRGFLP